MSRLSIVHWNDAYRVTPQKSSQNIGTIDVTQFAALLDDIRNNWPTRSDGARDGLSLFSGDLFSPSVESTATRGSHMVAVINELAPDVAVTGNHDFDFGYPHLSTLVNDTKFPWLLSNVIDEYTNDVPESLHRFKVLERSGVRVGIIGLLEEDSISTISAWPPNFKYRDMAETGREVSQRLRGEHRCDLIIALTHARVSNDIQLAKDLLALSPTAQSSRLIADEHGVDILLGGHDHFYFVSKGVTTWEGYDNSEPSTGSEMDHDSILIVKSGADFRDLSELTLELEDTPPGSIRKKLIKAVHGKRHEIRPGIPSSENLRKVLGNILSSVSQALKVPLCITEVELDLRSWFLRTEERAAANWFTDVLRHAYDDILIAKYGSASDGVLICSGTLRGDSRYPAGKITLGNILEILPFDDPVVVLELDGESLWDTLEAALSTYPKAEGSFPVVSGLRVSWDSRLPPGQRVLGIWLLHDVPNAAPEKSGASSGTVTPSLVDGEFIRREKNERTYKIVTREYMATGHCGYTALLGHEYLIDDKVGRPMSSLVQEYLLGTRRDHDHNHSREKEQETDHSRSDLGGIFRRQANDQKLAPERRNLWPKRIRRWCNITLDTLRKLYPRAQSQDTTAYPNDAEPYDGQHGRQTSGVPVWNSKDNHDAGKAYNGDLRVIHPRVDGRLEDVARN